jgi:hypothetical protein
MKWRKDITGRFPQRPHYRPEELDEECEALIARFLNERHGRIDYPIATDDLTVLIETLAADLDVYADLSAEEGEVEGVTNFFPGQQPRVRISRHLAQDPRMENRFRTTLTHELAHVRFHTFLFKAPVSGSRSSAEPHPVSNKCKRPNMLEARTTDWMEWQAGFACTAFLIPASALRQTIRKFMEENQLTVPTVALHSSHGEALLKTVIGGYQVSRDAARVRLLQKRVLVNSLVS